MRAGKKSEKCMTTVFLRALIRRHVIGISSAFVKEVYWVVFQLGPSIHRLVTDIQVKKLWADLEQAELVYP